MIEGNLAMFKTIKNKIEYILDNSSILISLILYCSK